MDKRDLTVLTAALCLIGWAGGCADDGRTGASDDDAGAGGAAETGGASDGSGGNTASTGGAGGALSSGGGRTTGGASATGGAPKGGANNAGGRSAATGGRPSTGGTPASGGSGGDTGAPPKRPAALTCTVTPSTAPPATWKNVTANLAGLTSECGNLTVAAADPCSNHVIAGVAKGGLWMTSNGGQAWTKLGSGAGSAAIAHRPSSIVFDPAHPDVFYESGIYGTFGDGVYKTTDGGVTFTQLGKIGHNDLVSVDFNDPDRKTLLAGAHETKQKLLLSTDGGANWTDIGPKLPAGSHFSSAPLVLDQNHFLLGACGWGDGTCGVFASSDAGQTWASVSTEGPSGRPLWASDGHLLWTTIWDSGAIESGDLGKTWSSKVSGPHSGFPVELPDGRIVAVGGDHLILSADGGRTWSNIGETLPYGPAGMTYSTTTKTFFIWRNDCGNAVLSDAVMSAGFDYEK